MLASLAREPFQRKGWVFEEKYDGYRIVAYKEGKQVQLISRNAIERAARYPHIAAAIAALKAKTLVLDGEAVVFDRGHVSRFQLLQRASVDAVFVAFRHFYFSTAETCVASRSPRAGQCWKRSLVRRSKKGVLHISKRLAADGLAAYKIAARKGLEGMIAKDLSSTYSESRSNQWFKVKIHQEDEFVIGGFTKPEGSRNISARCCWERIQLESCTTWGRWERDSMKSSWRACTVRCCRWCKTASSFVDWPREKSVSFLNRDWWRRFPTAKSLRMSGFGRPFFLGLRDDKAAKEVTNAGSLQTDRQQGYDRELAATTRECKGSKAKYSPGLCCTRSSSRDLHVSKPWTVSIQIGPSSAKSLENIVSSLHVCLRHWRSRHSWPHRPRSE